MTAQQILERQQELAFTEPCKTQGDVTSTHVSLRNLQLLAETEPPREPTPPLPPEEWLRRISVACLEVVHGRRNVSQLKTIISPRVAQTLSIRHTVQSRRTNRATHINVGRIRISSPHSGVAEVSTTFLLDQKAYPLALRLELTVSGWKITACDIGPH